MSYKAMGTMYATAGLGLGPKGYAPPWRPSGFHSFQGLGAYNTPTSLSVRVVQRGLIAASVSPSPGAADGIWGPRTQASLSAWLTTEAGRHRLSASTIRSTFGGIPARARTITLPNALASRLEQLSGGYRAPTPTAPRPSGGSSSTSTPGGGAEPILEPGDTGFAMPEWTPYALGGVALLGLGGFFLWQGRKARRRPAKKAAPAAALAANKRRRRRRRSSRRRSSRRRR
jgi:hypothetical protein